MSIWSWLTGGGKKKNQAQPKSSGGPRGQTGDRERSDKKIEDLIANKDKYQHNQIAGDNRNEYQMRMHALKTGQTFDPSNFTFTDRKGNQVNPGSDSATRGNASGAQAYKKRFPITSGIQNLGGALSNLIPGVGMAKGIFNLLGKMGKGAKTGFNTLADKTGIAETKVYQDLADAPSGFIGDFKDMITIGDGKEEDKVAIDIENIKNDRNNTKEIIATNNAVKQMAYEIPKYSNVSNAYAPYKYHANQNDFNALRGNRSLDFSQLAGAPNTGVNTVGIGGVNLDNTAYRNYLANKAGFADTGLNNTNMIEAMKTNPTLLNRGSPTGLNYNALGEVSNPQGLDDASLGYDLLNNRRV